MTLLRVTHQAGDTSHTVSKPRLLPLTRPLCRCVPGASLPQQYSVCTKALGIPGLQLSTQQASIAEEVR
ncbi:hypothetical protein Efla_000782 [Eimeria flavescens]